MDISTQSFTLARGSKGAVIRDFRHFSPNGFSENIWILFEGDEIGEELFDEICEKSFSHIFENEEEKSLSPVERFENAMKELNDKISQEANLPEDFLKKNAFVILMSFENQIHFTTLGASEIYFLRGGKVMLISDGISAENVEEDLFLNIASGEIQDGDVLFFSTLRLLRYVSHTQMQEIAQHSAKESVQTMAEFIEKEEGGVFGVIKADGAPALPFDAAPVAASARVSQSKGLSFHDLTLPPFVHNLKKYLPEQVKNEYLFLGIFIVFLLVIWSIVSLFSGGVSQDIREYRNLLESVNTSIGIAEGQKEEGRKSDALESLLEAEANAKKVFENPDYKAGRTKAQQQLRRIQEIKDDLSDTTRLSGKDLVDITSKKENVRLKGVLSFNEEFYAYDSSSLFRIIGEKVDRIVDLKDGESVIKGIPLEKKNEMVFLTDAGKVLEGTISGISYAKTEDPASWKKGIDIGYFDKNIYIFSPENNEVYKYVKKLDTFSSPTAYNQNADIKDGISMTIDGDIYVLKPEGQVVKMHQGKLQDFELKDVPDGFENVDQIYTLRELSQMFFVDTAEKRVYVFRKGKEGATFDQQYLIDTEDSAISGIWFDVNANRIIVATTRHLYEVPLTQ